MIKKFNQYNEGLTDHMKGKNPDEVLDALKKINPLDALKKAEAMGLTEVVEYYQKKINDIKVELNKVSEIFKPPFKVKSNIDNLQIIVNLDKKTSFYISYDGKKWSLLFNGTMSRKFTYNNWDDTLTSIKERVNRELDGDIYWIQLKIDKEQRVIDELEDKREKINDML